MTTTVTVSACCSDDRRVQVKASDSDGDIATLAEMSDGEEFVTYATHMRRIEVFEVPKPSAV